MKQKILIIDDNKGDIELIRELLDSEGYDYEMLWAENGSDGLELADKEQPDMVLLDIRMPGVDGHEICKMLKGPGRKNAHVIMMTSTLSEADRMKVKSFAADDHCIKLRDHIILALSRCKQLRKVPKAGERLRILLIEDNRGDQRLLEETLREAGIDFELTVLELAEQVVQIAVKVRPQVIFMDVLMPGVSGGDAVRFLRRDHKTRGIPVVFLTGSPHSLEAVGKEGMRIEGEIYPVCLKPVEKEHLIAILKKLVL